MFDLDTLQIKDSVEVQLRHPATDELLYDKDEQGNDDKTKPVQVVLWSTSSKPYRAAINAMQNRSLKRGKKQATAEVMREEGVKLLVACVQRFDRLGRGGKPLDNEEAITALFNDDKFSWVKTQCDEQLGDIANFI